MAGYWFGKMVSATLQHQQQRLVLGIVQAHLCMVTVSFSTIKAFNLSFSSRCLMKSTTMEKGIGQKLTFHVLLTLIKVLLRFSYFYMDSLIGKVAADHSHKWIYKEPNDQEINFLSAWHNSADSVSTYIRIHVCLAV